MLARRQLRGKRLWWPVVGPDDVRTHAKNRCERIEEGFVSERDRAAVAEDTALGMQAQVDEFVEQYAESTKRVIDRECSDVKKHEQELVAIHETIKLLNDGDSLELFKETLDGPTLLQLQSNREVIALVSGSPRGSSHLNLISMVHRGECMDVTKVIAMIDEMVGLLQEVQVDDDSKKTYCVDNVGKSEDEGKLLVNGHRDHQSSLSL